jgi:hypothetical protein
MAFTDKQARSLAAKLRHRYVKTRSAQGTTISYLEGWHVIAEATPRRSEEAAVRRRSSHLTCHEKRPPVARHVAHGFTTVHWQKRWLARRRNVQRDDRLGGRRALASMNRICAETTALALCARYPCRLRLRPANATRPGARGRAKR